jgi:hypothetical protein
MLRNGTIHGTSVRPREPKGRPLVDVIGTDVAARFMWISDVELDDEVRVHAYKHIATRRYLHVARDGRAFVCAGHERDREIRPRDAICDAFAGWEWPVPPPSDGAGHAAALRDASTHAAERTQSLREDPRRPWSCSHPPTGGQGGGRGCYALQAANGDPRIAALTVRPSHARPHDAGGRLPSFSAKSLHQGAPLQKGQSGMLATCTTHISSLGRVTRRDAPCSFRSTRREAAGRTHGGSRARRSTSSARREHL